MHVWGWEASWSRCQNCMECAKVRPGKSSASQLFGTGKFKGSRHTGVTDRQRRDHCQTCDADPASCKKLKGESQGSQEAPREVSPFLGRRRRCQQSPRDGHLFCVLCVDQRILLASGQCPNWGVRKLTSPHCPNSHTKSKTLLSDC